MSSAYINTEAQYIRKLLNNLVKAKQITDFHFLTHQSQLFGYLKELGTPEAHAKLTEAAPLDFACSDVSSCSIRPTLYLLRRNIREKMY